ncbi:MAG: hypothetical protein JXR76_27085 [Deltaproteobacteria bacterium]|nr:hypothetical protein [Deltaproteobacteria bacterium]
MRITAVSLITRVKRLRSFYCIVAVLLCYLSPHRLGAQEPEAREAIRINKIDEKNDSKPIPFGFAVAPSFLVGGGLHEKADVRNKFNTGAAVGGGVDFRFFEIRHLRLGLNLNFLHFTYVNDKGNGTIDVTSKINRLASLAVVEFYHKLFFVNGQVGAGFMIIDRDATFVHIGNSEITESNTVGIDTGFSSGLEVGMEFKLDMLPRKNAIRVFVHSDWMRRDERDDIVILAGVSFQAYSTFK